MGSSEETYCRMSLKKFVDNVATRSSLPGGGSVSAVVASLGSALACMGGLLTYGNKKFEKLDTEIRALVPKFYNAYHELIELCDQDGMAFTSYVNAKRMPEKSAVEKERYMCSASKFWQFNLKGIGYFYMSFTC